MGVNDVKRLHQVYNGEEHKMKKLLTKKETKEKGTMKKQIKGS
jgi:hypothetical protein